MITLQKAEFILVLIVAVSFIILTLYFSAKLRRYKKKAEKRIKTLENEVRHDYLTGTLTRKAFAEEMEASLAVEGSGMLLLFDINGFKAVNDMYGHAVGDGLIKRYAAKLQKEFGKDIVGRLGSDEFLVFIVGKPTQDEVNSRLKKSGVSRFADKTTNLQITSCCGAATAPENGRTFDDLFERADKALYSSKKNDRTISYCKSNL